MPAGFALKPPKFEAFRFVLRRSTAAQHASLDAHPAFAAMMDGTLSLEGYRRLMTLFHDFYARHDSLLQNACADHGVGRLGFDYAPRRAILARDLAALGGPSADVSAAADQSELAPVESAGSLGGTLYVLEGSMLGGGVLCKAVETLLAKTGSGGDGYWQWCRQAGGARWAMTCTMIEALAESEAVRDDMISGARRAFSAFAESLAEWRQGT